MIQVEGLRKEYGDRVALEGVSFTVPAGQVCGYLGPNGAGKTTTVTEHLGSLALKSVYKTSYRVSRKKNL